VVESYGYSDIFENAGFDHAPFSPGFDRFQGFIPKPNRGSGCFEV
jgi:hypothetical protein